MKKIFKKIGNFLYNSASLLFVLALAVGVVLLILEFSAAGLKVDKIPPQEEVEIVSCHINDLGDKVFTMSNGYTAVITLSEDDRVKLVFYNSDKHRQASYPKSSSLFIKWMDAEVGNHAVRCQRPALILERGYYYDVIIADSSAR